MATKQTYLRGNSIIDWGFDSKGGFYAIDHLTHHAAYAFPTSPNATEAGRAPGRVVKRMLDSAESFPTPEAIKEQFYATVCEGSRK